MATSVRFLKEGLAHAVKIESGRFYAETVQAGIPVMAHIGFTSQSEPAPGGYRVQGRGDDARRLIDDTKAVADAADLVPVTGDATRMVINRGIDNASVAIASLNRSPTVAARAQTLSYGPSAGGKGSNVFGIGERVSLSGLRGPTAWLHIEHPEATDPANVKSVLIKTSHRTHYVIGSGAHDPQKYRQRAARETLALHPVHRHRRPAGRLLAPRHLLRPGMRRAA